MDIWKCNSMIYHLITSANYFIPTVCEGTMPCCQWEFKGIWVEVNIFQICSLKRYVYDTIREKKEELEEEEEGIRNQSPSVDHPEMMELHFN